MTAEDLRKFLEETHSSTAMDSQSLSAYADLVSMINKTIADAADQLEPDDEPADFQRFLEGFGQ